MTVYAVHQTKDDISAAQQFGDVVFINKFYIHGDELEPVPDNTSDLRIPRGYAANMERAVAEFQPAGDFLLISGDHLQLLALAAMLAARHGSFNVLRWDRQVRGYIPVRLSSGLVPPHQPVLASITGIASGEPDIGDITDAEETRRNAQAVLNESPVRRWPYCVLCDRHHDPRFVCISLAPKRTS